MKQKIKALLFVAFLVTIVFNTYVFADVGNFASYDDGYSSSGYYSSSYDSYDSGNFWLFDSGSSSSSFNYKIELIIGGVILSIILIRYFRYRGFSNSRVILHDDYTSHFNTEVKNNTKEKEELNRENVENRIVEEIQKQDPNFSKEKFEEFAKQTFLKLQTAWTNRDWKAVRTFETNELYIQHSSQLQEFIDSNKINVVERISIVKSYITEHYIGSHNEFVTIVLEVLLRDYIIDASTKEVIEGNPDRVHNMKYNLVFCRKNGVKTSINTEKLSTTNCPNCGAPTEITLAGQCEYCGSVITTGEFSWVLNKLQGKHNYI